MQIKQMDISEETEEEVTEEKILERAESILGQHRMPKDAAYKKQGEKMHVQQKNGFLNAKDTLMMGDISGRVAGEFCKNKVNKALINPGIRMKEFGNRMKQRYYLQNVKELNTIVINLGNREVKEGMNKEEIYEDIREVVRQTKMCVGQKIRIVVCGLQSRAGRYLNKGIKEIVEEEGALYIETAFVPGYVTDKEEWEKTYGRVVRQAVEQKRKECDSQIGGTESNKTVFRSRVVWRK